jgi:phosphohistidine phosphatase SixA
MTILLAATALLRGDVRWAAPALQPATAQETPAAEGSTVFVVRHAERADAGAPNAGGMMSATDPPLSAAGQARARSLATILRDAGVKRIFSSEYRRTRQTAEPLASASGIEIVAVSAEDTPGLLRQLQSPSDRALVVGHSNTVPRILRALGVKEPVTIADDEYDNLFVVFRHNAGAELLKLKY